MDLKAVKNTFFDKKAVTDKLPPAIRSALSKFGAYTRRRDKNSLKYRDGSAPPGQPPHVHKIRRFTRKKTTKGRTAKQRSSPLRELTFFAFDAEQESVVIGPAPYQSEVVGAGILPAMIERRNPHTLPAFQAELPKAANNFKDLIR